MVLQNCVVFVGFIDVGVYDRDPFLSGLALFIDQLLIKANYSVSSVLNAPKNQKEPRSDRRLVPEKLSINVRIVLRSCESDDKSPGRVFDVLVEQREYILAENKARVVENQHEDRLVVEVWPELGNHHHDQNHDVVQVSRNQRENHRINEYDDLHVHPAKVDPAVKSTVMFEEYSH